MKKTELYTGYLNKEYFDSRVHDRWFDWRCEQAGVKRNKEDTKRWIEVLHGMPDQYTWSPSTIDNMMHFEWDGGTEEVPLTEFYDDEDEQPDLEMWWHSNYWDGPLSGMAKYNGEWVWFDCIEEDDYNGDRIFALYRLTEEQLKGETAHYFEFREKVGSHCDHHPDMLNVPREESTQKDFDEYYKKKHPDLKLTSGEKLGEFHWYQFKYWARLR
jgi:hypothetical protein